MRPPSILFLHAADEEFGSDRVLLGVVDAATAHHAEVRVLLPDDTAPGWLSAQLQQRGVPVSKVPLAPARRRYLRPRSLPAYLAGGRRATRTLRRALGDHVDIVYVNTSAIVVGALIPRAPGRRVIWHVHEVVGRPAALGWLLRLLPMWRADDVVATSDAAAAGLRRAPVARARLHRIYNGVPARPPAVGARREDRTLCAFAGRLQRRKGYDLFVEAAGAVAASFPEARFVVAGTPAPGEEWRADALGRRVAELGLADRVDLPGLCADVPALFDTADIVVVPSREPEAFGLVTVEAMRSGCAVIATTAGATPEIVADGVSGLLVPPGDLGALVGALRRLLGDADLRHRLGAAARARTEDFSEERFRADILRLLGLSP